MRYQDASATRLYYPKGLDAMSHEANEDRADAILPLSEILRQDGQEFDPSLPKEDVLTRA